MRHKSFTLTIAVLFAGSGLLATRSAAQNSQETSIADAARVNREQKKAAPKAGTLITNDTLNPSASSNAPAASPGAATLSANQAPGTSAQTGASADSKAAASAAEPQLSKEDADKLKAEIAALKQELKDKQAEVELSQRLLNLDREALYTKPDSSRDAVGKAKLDAEQNDLTQKTQEFEKLKAKLQSVAPESTSAQAPPKS